MVSLRFLRRDCHPVNLRLMLKLNVVLKSKVLSADIDRLRVIRSQAKELATQLYGLAKERVSIGRYERRALSRRKFAIRDFDAARRQAATNKEDSATANAHTSYCIAHVRCQG
jgi:hypothetical protein